MPKAFLRISNDAQVKTFQILSVFQFKWETSETFFPHLSRLHPFFLFSKLDVFQIKIPIISPFYHLRSDVICMHSWIPFTSTCIVNRTTTAHNDILDRIGKRNASWDDESGKAYCFRYIFAKREAEVEWKISLHIHIVASWILILQLFVTAWLLLPARESYMYVEACNKTT